jgi:hypothetical protein
LGNATDCSYGAGNNPGLCLFPEEQSGSVADVGFCDELCNCSADCTHPDTFCEAFPDSQLRVLTGRAGMCKPRNDPDATSDAGVDAPDELDTCPSQSDSGTPNAE